VGNALVDASTNGSQQIAKLDEDSGFARISVQRGEQYVWLPPRTDAPVYEDATGSVLAKRAYSGDLVYGVDGTPGLYASLADKALISDAQTRIQNLQLNPIYDRSDPNQYLIVVSADGTRNDASQSIPTNPYELRKLTLGASENVRTIYAKGVGTEWDFGGVNSALGLGQADQISDAYRDVVKAVNEIYEANPDAKFVFVTTGFSRGATTIRALQNLLVESGIPDRSSPPVEVGSGDDKRIEFRRNIIAPGKVNIGASVLFDTVNTGMGRLYDLSIPSQVSNVLHLTARDESRTFFPLVSALDPGRPNDRRILEYALPGSHTDIGGGSYDEGGLGHMNLQLAYTYL
jgi:hypothetical protein